MEFYNFIFQAWKVLKFKCGSWKLMGNQYALFDVNYMFHLKYLHVVYMELQKHVNIF